jgi:hypothetical protein
VATKRAVLCAEDESRRPLGVGLLAATATVGPPSLARWSRCWEPTWVQLKGGLGAVRMLKIIRCTPEAPMLTLGSSGPDAVLYQLQAAQILQQRTRSRLRP